MLIELLMKVDVEMEVLVFAVIVVETVMVRKVVVGVIVLKVERW